MPAGVTCYFGPDVIGWSAESSLHDIPNKPLPGRWKWNSTEGIRFDLLCPNDPGHVLNHVNRYDSAAGDLLYYVCKGSSYRAIVAGPYG